MGRKQAHFFAKNLNELKNKATVGLGQFANFVEQECRVFPKECQSTLTHAKVNVLQRSIEIE